MKKVTIFGGSFNPIHIGHLALGNYLCEWGYTNEVWFMVTPQNPLKRQEELLSDEKRLKLVQQSIGSYARFKASDFEFKLPKPSYTIHTLEALKISYPSLQFNLLIGADNWLNMGRWKESERLIRETEILIYPRYGYPLETSSLPSNAQYIQAPLLEISSTQIRRAFEEGKNPRFFLHPDAYQTICEEKLYIKKTPH